MSDDKQKTESAKTPVWQQVALIGGGTVFALLLMLGVLMLFPNLIGGDRLQRNEAGREMQVEFWLTDGDYWFHQAGRIRPPEEDRLLASYTLRWDDDGFRLPAMQSDRYPIAAFGDSFTEGTTVAAPWPDLLAAELDVPVRNFGYRGYGPREIAATAETFAGQQERSWVLYAHFSGNDLANANSAINERLMGRDPIGQVHWLMRQTSGISGQETVVENESGQYDYPMPVIIGGSYYEIALLEDLLWWQLAPEGGYEGTATFDLVRDTLNTVKTSANADACSALIFVPSKEQIYYPYIHEDVRQWIRGIARVPVTQDNGIIVLRDQPMAEAEEAAFIANLGQQRDAMRELAEREGWLFIDLLEPFQQAALERGLAGEELLYYQYDGHWTASGHALATEIIAGFMREHADECPLAAGG